MSSFFTSSDKIKVGQTDVSIPSENGLNYRAGGKIDLYIPPTSKFVDLSQTRLKFKRISKYSNYYCYFWCSASSVRLSDRITQFNQVCSYLFWSQDGFT